MRQPHPSSEVVPPRDGGPPSAAPLPALPPAPEPALPPEPPLPEPPSGAIGKVTHCASMRA
jgi:hypothetical protein